MKSATLFSLAQQQLPEAVYAIRDRFQQSTPILKIATDVLVLATCIAVPGLIVVLARKIGGRVEREHPFRLFSRLLKQLPLSTDERRTLSRMAHALRLAHPATLVLSPTLFTRYAADWLHAASPSPEAANQLETIKAKLFPHARKP